MSKTQEALRLALKALDVLLTEPIAHKAADEAEYLLLQAAPAIREALAQQQEPVQTTPNFAQLQQIIGGLSHCYTFDSKAEFLRVWIRDWTEHKLAKYTSPQPGKPWVGLVHEETHEAIGTAGVDLLELAKMWSDNKVHVYQFDNEARKIIEAVLRRASAKLKEKNHG